MNRFAGALALAASFAVHSQQERELWDWRGETTLRLENYDTRGDRSATPYPHSGNQETLGIGLDAERRPNPFDFTRFSFSGTASHSLYYAPDYGFHPERFNITQQSGTAALPYQAQVGDYFGVFSFRTLQTSLRGGMVELQPRAGHSLVALSGAAGQTYRDFQWKDNQFNGGSYLFESREWGRFAANWVNNSRQDTPGSQDVWSGAAEVPFSLGAQNLRFETELAQFSGDQKDTGVFGEFSSRGVRRLAPLDWRLRYERYGKGYRPAGAIVSPDRESYEGFAGWRFATGPALRARLQEFRDGWDSGNMTVTDTGGLTITGPLLAALLPGWTGNLDGYLQKVVNRAASPTDLHTSSLRADASRSYPNGITLRLGYGYLDIDNRLAAASSSVTQDVLGTLTHVAQWAGWRGVASYGATLRDIDGGTGAGQQVLPLVSLSLARGRHSILGNLSYAALDQRDPLQTDTGTTNLALAYRYDLPRDKLGAELASYYRSPTPGASTEAYRVTFTWTHLFQKTPVAQLGRAPLGPAPDSGPLDLRELAPGRSVATLDQRFLALAVRPGTRLAPNLVLYDYRMLDEITQRQRVGVQTLGGDIERAALVIDFDAVGEAQSMAQLFERVREALVRRYGQPASVFNRGEFRPTIVDDIQTDQFIRLTEWRTPQGVLRFGIPRRLDRIVRMEVQIARSFPDPTQTRWSIEELR